MRESFGLFGKSCGAALLAALAHAGTAFAGGTITNFTQAELEAAMAGGGTVLFAGSGTITLTNTITVAQSTTLDASNHAVTLSGGGAVRLFQVNSNVTFAVKGLTLASGRVVGANGADGSPAGSGQDANAAGILSQGVVALLDCTLSNHVAQGGNGGNDPSDSTSRGHGGNAYGAAICNLGGRVSLTNCLVLGNRAQGGLGTPHTILPAVWHSGNAGGALGGAIYSVNGSVELQQVTVLTNSAVGGASQDGGGGGDTVGGAIFAANSTVYVGGSVLSSNVAQGGGGSGSAGGNASGGALYISAGSLGTIQGCTVSGNTALAGYAYRTATGGTGVGGAVFNGGELRVVACGFSANTAGGAFPGGPGRGGAMYSAATLIVTASTFDNNLAGGGDGYGYAKSPGGPAEGGAVWSSGSLSFTNCTATANRAVGGRGGDNLFHGAGGLARGGAVYVTGGSATLVNVTVAANRADGADDLTYNYPPGPSQGGGLANTNGSVAVRNSIFANSTKGGEVWGTITDGGYNLCSDNTASLSAIGSLNNTDPLLSALSANGGATGTMALLVGSPARDAIPSGFPATDQRGVSRPQGPAADMGAFEADYIAAPPTIGTQPKGGTVRAGTNVTFIVAASGNGPLSYQWRKDGSPIPGATNTWFSLTNVQAAQSGAYSVVVTNLWGSTPSQGAVLVVDSTPLILAPPQSVLVSVGAATNFSVVADGPALAYQWWHDGAVVPGAAAPTLAISSALAGAQGAYFVVVTNFAGVATSGVATLTFDASAMSILVQPKDQTVEAGYPAIFTVLVSGVPPFAYQWQRTGAPITGATNESLTLWGVSTNDAGSYRVVVSNGYKMLTSSAAQLSVTPGASSPLLQVGRVGNNLTITFLAEAGRSYRLLYSTNLAGWSPVATNSALAPGLLQFVRPIPAAPGAFYRVATP